MIEPRTLRSLAGATAALLIGAIASTAVAEASFNDAGLARLSDRRGEPFAVQSVVLVDGEGERQTVKADPESYTLSEDGSRIEAAFAWGKVACDYGFSDDGGRLDLRVEVSNTSESTIEQIRLVAAKLKLEPGLRGRSHHNIGAPTVLGFSTETRSLAVCNTDVERPLRVKVSRAGADGVAELHVHAGGYDLVYDAVYMTRPIPPGKTDAYELSIRTGPPASDPHDLGQDVYDAFAEAHPPLLDWPDRRPINRLFFRGGAPKEQIVAHFRDPENNPPPQAGDEKFQDNVLKGIRRAVEAAKQTGAQGLIIWNIEGGSFPHPTTYIGDPRLVKVFNPDFDAVADEAFKIITDAGLHAGVCIRPTQIVYQPKKDTVGHRFTPVLEAHEENPVVEQLGAKIKYARDRWGATLFYVDTNYVWRPREPDGKWDAAMIRADVWRKLLKRFPDILIIPEFGHPEYFGLVGVYKEYDMGFRGTGERVHRIYPDGFHVAVIEDADPHEKFDLMVRNVRDGDALMTFAFGMTRNARAQVHIYKEAEIRDAGPPRGLDGMDEAALIEMLRNGEMRGRFYAAIALAETGGAAAAEALRAVVADEQAPWLVRKNAIRSLGERQDAAAVEVLLPLLSTTKPDLRFFAAEALGRIGAPAIEPLAERLGQGRFFVEAMGRIGDPRAAEPLIEQLEQERGRGKRFLIRALGMVGGPEAVGKLKEITETGEGFNRVRAAQALGEIGTPAAAEALRTARENENAKPEDEQYDRLIAEIRRTLNRIAD